MEIIKTIILGVVQGLTEFLPVSSSGHLILAQTFMGGGAEPEAGSAMFLEVMLHVATGFAVLVVFRKDILTLVNGWFSRDTVLRRDSFTYSGGIILATLPAAFVGIFFDDYIEGLFDTSAGKGAAYLAASMLFVTAFLLFYSSIKVKRGDDLMNGARGAGANVSVSVTSSLIGKLTLLQVIGIGLMQAVAIMPGISRSGSTIAMALILGVSRSEAGRFSFMLALPAIFGAALLDARKVESWGSAMSIDVILGFIASFIVGLIALKLLLSFVKQGKLHYFGYYCIVAALGSIVVLTLI